MKLVIGSDLHVDFQSSSINWKKWDPDSILVIAGDIANTLGDEIKLLRRVASHFAHVLVVDGNHTHYSSKGKRTIEEGLESVASQVPTNVHYLRHGNPTVNIQDIHFVGCNGWYCCNRSDPVATAAWSDEGTMYNDNRWIDFSGIPPWERAVADAELIDNEITKIVAADADARVVVATHTAPSLSLVSQHPRHIATNPYYANTYMEGVMDRHCANIELWIHGHTHMGKFSRCHGVDVACNPRGYRDENPRWDLVDFDI